MVIGRISEFRQTTSTSWLCAGPSFHTCSVAQTFDQNTYWSWLSIVINKSRRTITVVLNGDISVHGRDCSISDDPFFWHPPLVVLCARRRHQSPEWTIMSHIDCFIQVQVFRFQVSLNSLHPRSTRAFWWSPQVLQGGKLLGSSWSDDPRK